MARILSSVIGRISKRGVQPISHNDRLIISDYSDEEDMMYRNMHQRSQGDTSFPDPICFDGNENADNVRRTRSAQDNIIPKKDTRSIMDHISKISVDNLRTKPAYADCWLVGSKDDLEDTSEYLSPGGRVTLGTASDGEIEYNLLPVEYSYPDSINAVVGKAIEDVREIYRSKGGRMDKHSVKGHARGSMIDHLDTIEAVFGKDTDRIEEVIEEMCDTIHRHTVGMGVFDVLLKDPKLEDIYIDAPCDRNRIHITMNEKDGSNSHIKCRTNLMVDKKEILNLINILKRESGLQFCQSNPILETDIGEYDARATVVGYPMSPNGDALAIRKHSVRPWTLTRLVANGTMDPRVAGLLSFLVDNRSTFLICGARGAGKSSLLSALMFEFPLSQRILTIEDTMELPSSRMRKMGYKVQSMLIDDRMDGNSLSRADEALRVSLRMGESAIVLGEVRGEEAKTLYQSMRTGRAGSSIMGTIHGDSARSVYDRVVHDMNISPEAFMATDILVTLGTVRDRRTGNQIRRVNEVVATSDITGEFLDISDTSELFSSPVMRRVTSSSQLSRSEITKEIRARALIRSFLADIGKVHGDEYLGPEWVGVANEHSSRSHNGTAEEVLTSFKVKFTDLTGIGV